MIALRGMFKFKPCRGSWTSPAALTMSSSTSVWPDLRAGEIQLGFIKSPRFDTISNIIFHGKPNTAFKAKTKHDVDTVREGAGMALAFVSQNLGASDLPTLESHLTPECLEKLREELQTWTDDQRSDMAVAREDIFFEWIARASMKDDGTTYVLYSAMSHPNWGSAQATMAANKALVNEFLKNADPWKDSNEDIESKKKKLEEALTKNTFNANDGRITVSNVLLKETSGDWQVDALHMRNAAQILSPFFLFKLKAKMNMSVTTSWNFISVMRWDYATDAAMILCLILLIFR